MNSEIRRDILTPLRELENHYGQVEPSRNAESRLLARLDDEKQSRQILLGLAWNKAWRPLVFIGACLIILAMVLRDDLRQAQRSNFRPLHPNAPAASTELHESPPKTPAKPAPTFNDTIIPQSIPTSESRPESTPQWSPLPNSSFSRDEFVEPEQRQIELGPRMFFPQASNQSHQKPSQSSQSSAWNIYWPGSTEATRDNAMSSWNDSPSNTRIPGPTHNQTAPATHSAPPCQSPDTLKKEADLDCSEKGQTLSAITFLDTCANGQFRREKHDCVDADLEACVTDTLGDGSTCLDPGDLKTIAYETCLNSGQQLTDMSVIGDDCGGKVRMAKFTCCTPAAPEPPPPTCDKIMPPEISKCTDLAILKQLAFDTCTAKDTVLVDLQTWGDCPGGQASQMVVVCCGK